VLDDPRYAGGDKSGIERSWSAAVHVYYDLIASPLYEPGEENGDRAGELLSPLR